jgi:hypothetical protein
MGPFFWFFFKNFFFYSPFGVGKAPFYFAWGIPKGGRNYSPAGHGAGTQEAQKLNARKTLEHQYIYIYDTGLYLLLREGYTRHRQSLAMTDDPKHIITRGQLFCKEVFEATKGLHSE